MEDKVWKQRVLMTSTLKSDISDSYKGNTYCSTFSFMNINVTFFTENITF